LVDGVDVGTPSQYTFTYVSGDRTISVAFILTSSPFHDVRPGAWYYDDVLYVFAEGLKNGTGDNAFSPHVDTTRNMFVTILGRMSGIDPLDYVHSGVISGSVVNLRSGPGTNYAILTTMPRGTVVSIIGVRSDWFQVIHGDRTGYVSGDFLNPTPGMYSDVAAGRFYTPYVEWAGANGIVTGNDNGTTFRPWDTMTRQEMAVFLYQYSRVMGITLNQTALPPFSDLDQVAPWAREAVIALQQAEIVRGTGGGAFEPLGSSTRASVATMIANFHRIYG